MWYLFHSTICSSLYPCTGSILGMDSANGWRRYVMTTHGKSIQRCWWPSDISFHGITKSDIELNFRADYKLDYERRRYKVTPSLIGWVETLNQPWIYWSRSTQFTGCTFAQLGWELKSEHHMWPLKHIEAETKWPLFPKWKCMDFD